MIFSIIAAYFNTSKHGRLDMLESSSASRTRVCRKWTLYDAVAHLMVMSCHVAHREPFVAICLRHGSAPNRVICRKDMRD